MGISRLTDSVALPRIRGLARLRPDDAIAESLGRDRRPLTPNEWRSLGIVGGSFLVVAIAVAAFLPWYRALSWWDVALVTLVLIVSVRTRFVTESGHTAPVMLAMVPTLFLLPPPVTPLVMALACTLSRVPDVVLGRAAPDRPLWGIPNSWAIVGPAVLLALEGARAPLDTPLWVLILALALYFVGDVLASWVREYVESGLSLRWAVAEGAWGYAIDIALAPVGFLIAIAASVESWALILLVPLLLLMHYFSNERRRRMEQLAELNAAYRGTAMVLGDVVESDDAYTGEHSRGVVQLALDVALELGLDEQTCRRVDFGAMLHDVGKVAIPKEIINKPGPLDPEEWEIVKTHTVEGQRMLDQVGGLMRSIGLIVRAHHERWDGTGYPDGLKGEEIPIESRIVSACDTWSAMTTTRSYRVAMSHEAAMAELTAAAGTQLDPRVVDALIRVIVRGQKSV